MTIINIIYILSLVLASVLALAMCVYAWRRKNAPGAAPFAFMLLMGGIWALARAFEALAGSFAAKIVWAKVEYIGITNIVPFFLLFVLQYTHRASQVTRRRMVMIWLVPVLTILAVFTNEWHGLFWNSFTLSAPIPEGFIIYGHGPLFWLFLVYDYFLLFLSTSFLVGAVVSHPGVYRQQAFGLLLGAYIPWMSNLLYVMHVTSGLDITPISFALSGLIYALVIFRTHLLDILPVARTTVVESMSDGVIVVDLAGIIVDINQAARSLLAFSETESTLGSPLKSLLSNWPDLMARFLDVFTAREEISLNIAGQEKNFEMQISPFHSGGQVSGRVIVFRDITQRRTTEAALRESEERFRRLVETAPNGIIISNGSGKILEANPSAGKIFGYSADELIGQNIDILVPVESRELHPRLRNEYTQTRQMRPMLPDRQLFGVRKDGSNIPLEISLSCIETKEELLIASIIHDVHDRIQAEERLRLQGVALDSAANGIVITDLRGRISWVNPAFSNITGYSFEEVIGKNTNILKSGATPDSIYQDLWASIQKGQVWQGEIINKRKDGSLYTEEMTIAPVRNERGEISHFIAIKSDVSRRKQAEEALARRLRELASINEISRAVAAQLDVNALIQMAGDKIQQIFKADAVFIALYSRERRMIYTPYWNIRGEMRETGDISYGVGLTSRVLEARQPLLIDENYLEESEKLGVYREPNNEDRPKSWLGVPIMVGDVAIGVLCAQDYLHEHAFSQADVNLLTTIASTIGISIKNAQLFQQAEEKTQEAEQARDIATRLQLSAEAVSRSLSLSDVLNAILNQMHEVFGYDTATIQLVENDSMRVIVGHGIPESEFNLVRKLPDYPYNQRLATNPEPIIISNVEEQDSWKPIEGLPQIRCHLGIPLTLQDKIIGALTMDSFKSYFFTDADMPTALAFARQAAIAIENAHLYEETERRAKQMEMLYHIGLNINSSLDLVSSMLELFKRLRKTIPMDSFYIATYDEKTKLIHHPIFYDGGEFFDLPARDILTQPGLSGRVIKEAKTIYIPDSMDEETRRKYSIIHIGGKPVRSYVGVPLIRAGKVLGVISMQRYPPHAFSHEEVRLLETIATQAAAAVENSLLYEKARREIDSRSQAEESLRKANRILQDQLMEIEKLQNQLREQAIRDPLTGLFNRRYLNETLQREIASAARNGANISILMIDIDHFKHVNDTHGHGAGDVLLKALSELIRSHSRASDIACRMGGEEFLLVLLGTPCEIAIERAEQLRTDFEALRVPYEDQELTATISLGISTYPTHGTTEELLLINADKGLYTAKETGRNRVVISQP